MAERKQFVVSGELDEAFVQLLAKSASARVGEDVLHEQRVSFAFGNAPDSDRITRDTVRRASEHLRLMAD